MEHMYFTIYRDMVIWFGDEEECAEEAFEYKGARVVRLNPNVINIEYLIADLKKLKGATNDEIL